MRDLTVWRPEGPEARLPEEALFKVEDIRRDLYNLAYNLEQLRRFEEFSIHLPTLITRAYGQIVPTLTKDSMITIIFLVIVFMTVCGIGIIAFSKSRDAIRWALEFLKLAAGFYIGTLTGFVK